MAKVLLIVFLSLALLAISFVWDMRNLGVNDSTYIYSEYISTKFSDDFNEDKFNEISLKETIGEVRGEIGSPLYIRNTRKGIQLNYSVEDGYFKWKCFRVYLDEDSLVNYKTAIWYDK